MKRTILPIVIALLLITGCNGTNNTASGRSTQPSVYGTEEEAAPTRAPAGEYSLVGQSDADNTFEAAMQPEQTPKLQTDAPATAEEDPLVEIKDGKTTVLSKAFRFSVSFTNQAWICDSKWDRDNGLSPEFIYVHKTPQTERNLVGITSYPCKGDMDKNLKDKANELMEGIEDVTEERLQSGDVSCLRYSYTLYNADKSYRSNNVLWYEGNQLYRITSVAEAKDDAEVWNIVTDMLQSFCVYEG